MLSKYAWLEPLKDKTGKAVTVAFERILKRAKRQQPLRLWTDAGKEFYNCLFQGLLTRQKIRYFSTSGDTKTSVVERFNRTLSRCTAYADTLPPVTCIGTWRHYPHWCSVITILGDPGAVSRVGRKDATKVFKYRRKSPWVPTLTELFPKIQADASS